MHTKTWREKKMPNTVPNMETGESLFACIYINLVRRQHVLVVDGDEGAEAGEGDEDGDAAEDEVDEGGEGVLALQEHELLVADLVHLRRRRECPVNRNVWKLIFGFGILHAKLRFWRF